MKANSGGNKGMKKALRLLIVAILVILLLPAMVGLSLLIPSVQTAAVSFAAGKFGEFLETEVSLESIYLKPFSSLQCNGLLVMDQNNDTLAYMASLEVSIQGFDRSFTFLNLGTVEVEGAYFNLYEQPDSTLNLEFLIDAFRSEDTTKSDIDFVLTCSRFDLSNARFRFEKLTETNVTDGIDFMKLGIRKINASIEDIEIDGAVIQGEVLDLRFIERSGFEMKQFKAISLVTPDSITTQDLFFESNASDVQGNIALRYQGWEAFSDFLAKVKFDAELYRSFVAVNDIAYFAPRLRETLTDAEITGKVTGSIDNLKVSVDTLRILNTAYLEGDVRLKGLPDVDQLFIQADVSKLFVRLEELDGIILPVNDGQRLELPEQVLAAETLRFKGSYTGFFDDFVAYGELQSGLGRLNVDVNLKNRNEVFFYGGTVRSAGFDLAKLSGSNQIGKAAFDLKVTGREFDFARMQLKASGNVRSIDILGYQYKDIALDGALDKRVFSGKLSIKDTNIILAFDGQISLQNELPEINCETDIKRLNLAALNILPEDTLSTVNGLIRLTLTGKTIESLHGEVALSKFSYSSKNRSLSLDTVFVSDELVESGHSMNLYSDYFSASVVGATTIFDMPSAFQQLATAYLPHYFPATEKQVDTTQQFTFTVNVDRKSRILDLVSAKLDITSNIVIKGNVDTRSDYFKLKADSMTFTYGDARFERIGLNIEPSGDSLIVVLESDNIEFSEDYFLSNVVNRMYVHQDTLNAQLRWKNESDRGDEGKIELDIALDEANAIKASLNKLDVVSSSVNWVSAQQAFLRVDTNSIDISNLMIRSDDGQIACNGTLSDVANDTMKLSVRKFDLSYIGKLGLTSFDAHGFLDANVDVRQSGEAILLDAFIDARDLVYSEVEFGNISGKTSYSDIDEAVDLDIVLDYQEQKNISVTGQYFPFEKQEQLDLKADLHGFRVVVLEPFLSRFVSDLGGEIDGIVNVSGKLAEPSLEGDLELNDFQLRVNYLNTFYQLPSGTVNVRPDYIGCDVIPIIDEKGSVAKMTATVFHENFKDLNYNIYLDANDFLCLNTTVAQNELYYGRANITGDIDISGGGAETSIEVIATTNKKTQLFIPLDKPGEVSDLDYIHFVGSDEEARMALLQEKAKEQLKGLKLDFQLDVNDNAEIQIIFDEKIGDIIKVRGAGDMTMEIDTRGKFNMYGDYTINSGDYLFTLQNVINKHFAVEQGSKISWNGSPYDAQIDLAAIYSLRTTPYNLVASTGDTSDYYKQRMPVDVYLKMKGALQNPDLSFDVDLPSLPESDLANQLLTPTAMNSRDLNKQVFSLLLVNSFAPQEGFSTEGLSNTTGFEVLSNQFSNWASQYFENIDIGVNYRQGNQETTADQAELTLTTELFNNRVLVEVNGRVQGDNPGQENEASNVAGEFNVEYKISESEKSSLRARVFNEANNYNAVNLNQSPYTQGAGIFYRKEFDGNGFLKRLFGKKEEEGSGTEGSESEEAPEDQPE